MKNIKEKIFKNILPAIIFAIPMFAMAEMMANQVLKSFKPLWFAIFFVSYGVVMFNLTSLLNLKHMGKQFTYVKET